MSNICNKQADGEDDTVERHSVSGYLRMCVPGRGWCSEYLQAKAGPAGVKVGKTASVPGVEPARGQCKMPPERGAGSGRGQGPDLRAL